MYMYMRNNMAQNLHWQYSQTPPILAGSYQFHQNTCIRTCTCSHCMVWQMFAMYTYYERLGTIVVLSLKVALYPPLESTNVFQRMAKILTGCAPFLCIFVM